MRKILATSVIAAVAVGLSLFVVLPASAATACTGYTSYSYYPDNQTWKFRIPSAGQETGNVNCTLRNGNRGQAVSILQESLKRCRNNAVSVDGIYGNQTRDVVRSIQQFANGSFNAGLAEDGIYGPATRNWVQWMLYPPAGSCWTWSPPS